MSAGLSAVWALLIFGAFLLGHSFDSFKPFIYASGYFSWSAFLSAWGGRLVALAAFGVWLVFLSEWGRPVGRWILGDGAGRRLSRISGTRMGIGFGILGMAVFALGLSGLLFPTVLFLAALAPAVLFRGWACLAPLGRVLLAMKGRDYFKLSRFHIERTAIPWLLLAALPILFALPLVLTPEGSWDAMVYHLRFPSFFLMEHKRFLVTDSPFVGYPDLAGMHYVLALGLGGSDIVAKYQHMACWLFSGAAIFSVTRQFGRVAGWGSLLVWLGSAMGMQLAGLSYVDHSVAWMAALCAAFIGNASLIQGGSTTPRVGETGWSPMPSAAFLAGIFAGWCASAKYTGGFAVIGLLAGVFRVGSIRPLIPAIAGMALAGGAWPMANILELGNPLYPFLTGIFGGISSPAVDFWRASPLGDISPKGGWLSGLWFRLVHDDGGVGTPFGALWIAVLLPAFITGPRDLPRLRFFGAALIIWLVSPLSSRFLLPFIPAGLMAAAPAWSSRQFSFVLVGAILAFLPVSLYDKLKASVRQYNALVAGSGLMSRVDFLRHGLQPKPEYWDGAMEINRNTPKKSRFLLVSGIKSYYIERRAMVSHQHLDPVPLFRFARSAPSADRMAIRLRQLGISHILYLDRALEGATAARFPWMDEAAYSRYVEWWRGWTSFDFRVGESLVYSVSYSRNSRILGRLPVLEQAVMAGYAAGDRPAGRAALARLVRLAPESSSADMARGLSILMGGGADIAGAAEPLSRAVKSPEASSVSWRALGYVMTKQGNQDKAGTCFLEAVALNPEDAEAHFNLGQVYMRMDRKEAALMEMYQAISIDPSRADFRRALAIAQMP